MHELEELFQKNRAWAAQVTKRDPEFFQRLSLQQSPQYLWIGCADSRVPANEIIGLLPGELFVHRNISNLVVHTDLNCLSVLQYAVDVLRVKHIIVCGHYGCGGIEAAWSNRQVGLSDNWLRHVQDVRHKHQTHFSQFAGGGLQNYRQIFRSVAIEITSYKAWLGTGIDEGGIFENSLHRFLDLSEVQKLAA